MKGDKIKHLPFEINGKPSFIGAWSLDNQKICDELVLLFGRNKLSQQDIGFFDDKANKVAYNKDKVNAKYINITIDDDLDKESTILLNYTKFLRSCYFDYCKRWQHTADSNVALMGGKIRITQLLKSDNNLFDFVYEKQEGGFLASNFNFITYLNAVEDGGSTEFYYFDSAFKALKGLTLIFPNEWMFKKRTLSPINPGESLYTISGSLGYHKVADAELGISLEELENLKK